MLKQVNEWVLLPFNQSFHPARSGSGSVGKEKEDAYATSASQGIEAVGRKQHPLKGLLGKQWPPGRARLHLEQEDGRKD